MQFDVEVKDLKGIPELIHLPLDCFFQLSFVFNEKHIFVVIAESLILGATPH